MILESLSPTLLDTFDETTPFGCERRGWFKYVLKNPEPTLDNQMLGLAVHERNEKYLLIGAEYEPGQLPGNYGEFDQQAYKLFQKGKSFVDQLKASGRIRGVEAQIPEQYRLNNLPLSRRSKCDVVLEDGILDWKTTSSIKKYGKTPGELAKNTQMLMYADAFLPDLSKYVLTHGQYETKGAPKFDTSSVTISRQQLDDRMGTFIVPLVEKVKQIYLVPAARDVKPNRDACWRCPHKGICPSEKVNPLMGVFDKFKKPGSTTEVKPPDAPASDPKLAAKPVEGADVPPAAKRRMLIVEEAPKTETKPEVKAETKPKEETKAERLKRELAEEEAKEAAEKAAEAKRVADEAAAKKAAESEKVAEEKRKGPGRPPGSKNKPKQTVTSTPDDGEEELTGMMFTKTTVSFGATLNMGDFNNVRIDVSHTVEYGDGDVDAAYEAVLAKCKEQVEAEVARLQAGPEVKG